MASMEHLIVTYGDLVRVTNSFVKWGLGSGWVAGLVKDGGKLAGVRLSETVTLTAGQEYSIRFRLASRRGQTLKADIAPVAESVETDSVTFAVPLSGVLPAVDDLYQFGYRDRESHECLVEGIVPEAGGTAKITVCDYSPEIYDVDDGAIPAYDSDISEPQLLPSVVIASVPLGNVYSDERALAWDNGSLRPRIGVGWKNPDGLERQVEYVQFRIIHLGADDDEPRLSDSVPIGSGDVYFDNVAEGDVYKVHGRYLTGLGVTGQWATLDASHKVIGRTLPPPDVANVRLSIASPLGVLVSWDAVDTLDVSHYVVSGDLSGRTSGTSLAIPPYNITGAVHASVVAVDSLGLVSETPTQGSVTINGPARPAITSASLQTEGIAVSWRDAARTWPVARYIVTLGGVTVISQTATAIIPVPQSFAAGDAVTVQAVDIFNNAGEVSEAVEVAITPPKTPEIKLALNAGDGTVTVVWQDCATVCPIRHYVISGAMSGTSTGTSASLPAPKAAGGVTVQVVAVDVYGIESGTGQATLAVTAPENPVIKAEVRTDGLYLAWQDCAASWPVRHYVITDPWAGETYTSLVTSQAVPPRPAGTYLFGVRAVDTVGLASSTTYASVELGGVGRAAPSIRVDGADLVISWPRVASSFPIDRYEIVTVQGEQIGSAKTTYYRFPCPAAGTHGYRVRAVDAAGNLGEWGEASISVDRPEPPQVTAALDGAGITVRWTATGHQLPIVAWDLVRQWEEARDDGVIETHEEDYGRLDVDCLTVPAVSTGVHYFMVRAVDSAGNVSGWGDCDFTVVAPGKVAFVNCATVDNNVILYWTAPDTVFFPIREYVFSEIDGDGYEMEIGRIDAQFASSFETVSGEYVYGVTPVDAGGNRGALSTIKMAVSQPPDFVFYHNKDSLFNGVKANFVLDGRGSMIGPVPEETWTENVARAGLLAGRAVESWQDKNAANYLTWLEPAFGLPLASYDGALWGRIYYQDVGADGMTLFPDKERAWKYANADGTLFSQLWMLRDAGESFRQADRDIRVPHVPVRHHRADGRQCIGLCALEADGQSGHGVLRQCGYCDRRRGRIRGRGQGWDLISVWAGDLVVFLHTLGRTAQTFKLVRGRGAGVKIQHGGHPRAHSAALLAALGQDARVFAGRRHRAVCRNRGRGQARALHQDYGHHLLPHVERQSSLCLQDRGEPGQRHMADHFGQRHGRLRHAVPLCPVHHHGHGRHGGDLEHQLLAGRETEIGLRAGRGQGHGQRGRMDLRIGNAHAHGQTGGFQRGLRRRRKPAQAQCGQRSEPHRLHGI